MESDKRRRSLKYLLIASSLLLGAAPVCTNIRVVGNLGLDRSFSARASRAAKISRYIPLWDIHVSDREIELVKLYGEDAEYFFIREGDSGIGLTSKLRRYHPPIWRTSD